MRESEGDPFSFLVDKGKGKGEEGDGDDDDDDDDDEEEEEEEEEEEGEQQQGGEEDQEDQEDGGVFSEKPAISPTPAFDIDYGIPLPCDCKTPSACTKCLQQLVLNQDNGKFLSK